jgi:nitrite reductase/ring-hydroxylating ferredoxin subunit
MHGFFSVGSIKDFPIPNEIYSCNPVEHPAGHRVNIIRSPSTMVAIKNVCPHKGAPLHKAAVKDIEDLEKSKLTCMLHGWRFSLKTGKSITNEYVIEMYDIVVENEQVWVSIEPNNNDIEGIRSNAQELVYNPGLGWI